MIKARCPRIRSRVQQKLKTNYIVACKFSSSRCGEIKMNSFITFCLVYDCCRECWYKKFQFSWTSNRKSTVLSCISAARELIQVINSLCGYQVFYDSETPWWTNFLFFRTQIKFSTIGWNNFKEFTILHIRLRISCGSLLRHSWPLKVNSLLQGSLYRSIKGTTGSGSKSTPVTEKRSEGEVYIEQKSSMVKP